ncbi:MAG TPA: IS1380 family transposase [Terracidiphilus sp.]|nr:IS1380 family transposase [Terracidiphilus sp.]
MTECNQSSFEFASHFSRQVTATFDGGTITSDGGALLLREADRKLNLLERFSTCFRDHRRPDLIEHQVSEMVSQRVYGLALGYEDINDHDRLRSDPLMGVLAGKADASGQQRRHARDRGNALAGKSTLNRLEQAAQHSERYCKIEYSREAIDELMIEVFLEAHPEAPAQIVLDLDATDVPLHGQQERRFFHGYYDAYCYLPLYIFCGEHVLCARLRPANIDGAKGSVWEVRRLVQRIRRRWPQVRIVVRADSGFCRQRMMGWCERHGVDYVLGLARNPRLKKLSAEAMAQAKTQAAGTGQPARVFVEFPYATEKTWSRERRVIAKAECLQDKENPRYVVTSLSAEEWPAQRLYEEFYCARGEMENRIKEQGMLFHDRLSTATMRSNQLRLYFSAVAYMLVQGLRRLALAGTELAVAQMHTIRIRLLKIGAVVRLSARRVWLSLATGYPWQNLFREVWQALRC